jgi:hypothetical protein
VLGNQTDSTQDLGITPRAIRCAAVKAAIKIISRHIFFDTAMIPTVPTPREKRSFEIMHKQRNAILAAMVLVVAAVACAPTDSNISTKVKENLTADETLKDFQIDVGVQNKVVTLSGSVNASGDKERAVTVTRRTAGVTDVLDHVTIKDQGPGPAYGREMMQNGMSEAKDHPEQEKHP